MVLTQATLAAQQIWAAYVYQAMARAVYETLPDDGTVYAEIPGFQGVWANEPTFDACRAELLSVLEDWLMVRLKEGLDLPAVPGTPSPTALPS